MMVTFKSQASADVMMFGDVAKTMLAIIGKEYSDQGIITVESLPLAIAKLKDAIKTDAQRKRQPRPLDDAEPAVGVAQRAVPLVEMFEWSLISKVPVVWGV